MKKIKILTIILAIVLITMISFCGVYVQYQNRMENKVKDYSYAMDLEGSRNIKLKVNTENETIIKDSEGNIVENEENLTDEQITEKGYTKEEKAKNSEEIKNAENYNKSKKIIESRLKELKVQNYIIKLDEQTGDIIVEIPENDKTDSIISTITAAGKFEIVDSDTNEVLMNNNDIKTANVLYGSSSNTTSSGTNIYLSIEFTKEGAKKLEDISNEYIKNTEENETETSNTEENEEQQENESSEKSETKEKKITMKIDNQEIMSTSFEEPLRTGKLQLSIGRASTDEETLKEYIEQASNISTVLKTGNVPVIYELDENKYILSDIIKDEIIIAEYILAGILAIALVVLAIRYKLSGILGAISYIGLASLLMLTIRYTNVVVSIEGIFGIAIIFILNYILVNKLVSNIKKEDKQTYKEIYKEFFIKILPIIIMVITFCFTEWIPISSFGMVMFWGIALIALYNIIVTNNLLKIEADKKIGGNDK